MAFKAVVTTAATAVDIEELLHEKQLSVFNRSSYGLESNKAIWKQEGGAFTWTCHSSSSNCLSISSGQ